MIKNLSGVRGITTGPKRRERTEKATMSLLTGSLPYPWALNLAKLEHEDDEVYDRFTSEC